MLLETVIKQIEKVQYNILYVSGLVNYRIKQILGDNCKWLQWKYICILLDYVKDLIPTAKHIIKRHDRILELVNHYYNRCK